MQLPLSSSAPLRPSGPSPSHSNHRGLFNFNFMPTFPPTGITPPHPHPVAPFPPPPPHSYGTLQHGPVSPAPLPSVPPPPLPSVHSGLPVPPQVRSGPPVPPQVHSGLPVPPQVHSGPPTPPLSVHSGPPAPLSVHSGPPAPPQVHGGPSVPQAHSGPPQPFYSLAMTHLPPNVQPRPLPHTHLTSPYSFSQTSLAPSRGIPSSTIAQPPPSPTAIRLPITCTRCGHFMLADLSGCGLSYSPPPPVGSHSGASSRPLPLFFKHPQSLFPPQPSHPLQFNPFIQHPVSPMTYIRTAATSRRRRSASRDGPSSDSKAASGSHKPTKKKGNLKSQEEITLQSVSRIIPYRERKKPVPAEVYARQQLEVEFSTFQKPTISQMADMSQRLGVSKEFVRQWFSSRRQKQKQLRTLDPIITTIPSVTHDITIEVPPVTPNDPAAEETSNATVTIDIFTTRL